MFKKNLKFLKRRLLKHLLRWNGAILTFHSVPSKFELDSMLVPNYSLEISPSYLENIIDYIYNKKLEIISINELLERINYLKSLDSIKLDRRFVCFTFDDGYRNIYENAYPILKKHRIPFTVFLTTGFPDNITLDLMRSLDRFIQKQERITIELNGKTNTYQANTRTEKIKLFKFLYPFVMKNLESEHFVEFCKKNKIEYNIFSLTWSQVQELASDQLVTIGAHTIYHKRLTTLSESKIYDEINGSKKRIEEMIHKKVEHFSFPYGSVAQREFLIAKDCGFKTLSTSKWGYVFYSKTNPEALPRIEVYFNKLNYFL